MILAHPSRSPELSRDYQQLVGQLANMLARQDIASDAAWNEAISQVGSSLGRAMLVYPQLKYEQALEQKRRGDRKLDAQDLYAMQLGRPDWQTLQSEIGSAGGFERWQLQNFERGELPKQRALQQLGLEGATREAAIRRTGDIERRREYGQIALDEAMQAEALQAPEIPPQILQNRDRVPQKLWDDWAVLQNDALAIQTNADGILDRQEQLGELAKVRTKQRALVGEMAKHRPPTKQELFDASTVTLADGRFGLLDDKGHFEDLTLGGSALEQERAKKLRQLLAAKPEDRQKHIDDLRAIAALEAEANALNMQSRRWKDADGRTYIIQPEGKMDVKDPPKAQEDDLFEQAWTLATSGEESAGPVTPEQLEEAAGTIMQTRETIERMKAQRAAVQKAEQQMQALATRAPLTPQGGLDVQQMVPGELYAVDTQSRGRIYLVRTPDGDMIELSPEDFMAMQRGR